MKIYTTEMIKSRLAIRKKIGRFFYVAFCVLLVFAIICAAFALYQKIIGKRKNVTLLGFTPFIISSGSMDPTLKVYDLVVVMKVREDKISKGDIIAYIEGDGYIITHRVDVITVKDGKNYYSPKGDANNASDDPIPYEKIVGRYCFKIPGGGILFETIISPMGIIFLAIMLITLSLITKLRNNRKAARHAIREKYRNLHVV